MNGMPHFFNVAYQLSSEAISLHEQFGLDVNGYYGSIILPE
jgi:hypothetical protein